jgi:hypothetical protein
MKDCLGHALQTGLPYLYPSRAPTHMTRGPSASTRCNDSRFCTRSEVKRRGGSLGHAGQVNPPNATHGWLARRSPTITTREDGIQKESDPGVCPGVSSTWMARERPMRSPSCSTCKGEDRDDGDDDDDDHHHPRGPCVMRVALTWPTGHGGPDHRECGRRFIGCQRGPTCILCVPSATSLSPAPTSSGTLKYLQTAAEEPCHRTQHLGEEMDRGR